jgi:DNA-binding transcriptional MocR family regulator
LSFEAYRWAKTWNGLLSNQKFVLVMLADHYNDEKRCAWPSTQTLADETGMSRRTVIRCIEVLERVGLIEVEHWINAYNGKQMSNRYFLPMYDSESCSSSDELLRVYPDYNNETGELEYDVPAPRAATAPVSGEWPAAPNLWTTPAPDPWAA